MVRFPSPLWAGTSRVPFVGSLKGSSPVLSTLRRFSDCLRTVLLAGMSGTLILVSPLPAISHSGGLVAQTSKQDARVMPEGERDALRQWARLRLEELESGSESTFSGLPHSRDTERLWALYFMSVEEKAWEKPALALADTLGEAGLPEALQVEALAGALEVVRAKNSRWPPNKLKYLRRGLLVLNRLVEETPGDPVVRYLRLMSCYYLPFFLDQDDAVKEDFEVLATLLPDSEGAFSPPVYEAVLQFVLENGDSDPEARSHLETALADHRASRDLGGTIP
jgi:hypothetical protein